MRKLIATVLAAITLTFGAPAGLMAQSLTSQAGSISGETVDAGGRGVPIQRVELVQAGRVVQTTTTSAQGRFVFGNVATGDYVVRVLANGQPAGVRVSVAPGAAAHALIVLPSAAAPSAAFLGLLGLLLIAGAVIATVIIVANTGS
jgi:hypothetical protein